MLSDAHHRYLIPPWNLYKYGTHWFLLVLATIWSLPSKLIKIVIDYAILVVSADLFIKGFNSRKNNYTDSKCEELQVGLTKTIHNESTSLIELQRTCWNNIFSIAQFLSIQLSKIPLLLKCWNAKVARQVFPYTYAHSEDYDVNLCGLDSKAAVTLLIENIRVTADNGYTSIRVIIKQVISSDGFLNDLESALHELCNSRNLHYMMEFVKESVIAIRIDKDVKKKAVPTQSRTTQCVPDLLQISREEKAYRQIEEPFYPSKSDMKLRQSEQKAKENLVPDNILDLFCCYYCGGQK